MNLLTLSQDHTPTFQQSKFRRMRSPLQEMVTYDIYDPSTFPSYHAVHTSIADDELADLIARAKANQRRGDEYVPPGLTPASLHYFHVV